MRCIEIIKHIEDWAPTEISWQNDNTGLQVGSVDREVNNIFLCLELTENAVVEAVKRKCNFIYTHHPLIFHPLKKIDTDQNKISRLIETLIKNDITLYCSHTNLDFAKGGVSYKLAEKLGLINVRFLKNSDENQYKLVVFVPSTHLKNVADAIFSAGGGVIGEYKKCSYRMEGKGSFEGSEDSNPAIGTTLKYEEVDEIRFEVIVNSWIINDVITSLLKVHPYEEPAYDIYPVKNKNGNFGYGAIGELQDSIPEQEFLEYTASKLNLKNFRYTKGTGKNIKTAAVCGGSGSDLINTAISAKADAYITADIKYHPFHDATGKILLIDAGHYETEIFALGEVKNRIENFIKTNRSVNKIYLFKGTTNPIEFYKN